MFFAQLAIGVTHPHRRLCSCLSWCDDGDNGQKDAVHHKLRHMNANALLLPHPANRALSRTFFERCHGKFPKRYGALKSVNISHSGMGTAVPPTSFTLKR